MEYMPQVKVSKEDFLALSDLAGEMSIMDYMSKVIHEHVTAKQKAYGERNAGLKAYSLEELTNEVFSRRYKVG